MAVKAIGAIVNPPVLQDDGDFQIFLNISSNNTIHYNVDGGTYSGGGIASVINAQVVALIKAYAIAEMGATFGILDTARLIIAIDLLS